MPADDARFAWPLLINRFLGEAGHVDAVLADAIPPGVHAAEALDAIALLLARLHRICAMVGQAHAAELPETDRDSFRQAVIQLAAAQAGLTGVGPALRAAAAGRATPPS